MICVAEYPLSVLKRAGIPALLLVIVVAGCGDTTEDKRGTRVGGNGLVSLDGRPLEAGRIVFITDHGSGAVKAVAAIRNGSFTFTEKNGPLEGGARVEIHPVGLELEDFEAQRGGDPTRQVDVTRIDIPARYNVKSDLTAVVCAKDGISPVNFELSSK